MKKKNIYITFGYIAVYLMLYLAGRIIWCDAGEGTLIGWLFTATPSGEHSYLYGWLLSSNLFWYAAVVSVLPSLWGRFRFSAVTAAGFVAGFVAGIIWGPNPQGAALGQGHYGWAIWGVVYIISIAAGAVAEKCRK